MKHSTLKWLPLTGFILILALPLLSIPPWFSPPSWGKVILFRILVSVLLFFAAWFILRERRFPSLSSLKQSPAFWPIALLLSFTGTLLLSTLFSLEPFFSFWGTPSRSWGTLNFSFYVLFALLAFSLVREKQWKTIWTGTFIVGILVSLIALAQQFGWQLTETFATVGTRPHGSMGNPIILAMYLLLLSFPALAFGLKEPNKNRRFFLLALFSLFTLVTALTITRGALLGLAIGLFYFFFFYPKKTIIFKPAILSLVLLGVVLVASVNLASQPPEIVRQNEQLRTFWDRLLLKSAADDPRIAGWRAVSQAIFDRPILGYGPYNSSIGFDRYYTSKITSATGWWDSAHNLFLDIALWAGIPGLLLFLFFIGVLFQRLHQVKQKIPEHAVMAHGVQAAFISYLVAAFFFFDTFSTYLLFFLLVAYALHLISQDSLQLRPIKLRIPLPLIVGAFGLFLIWFTWQENLKPLVVNKEVNVAFQEASTGRCEQAFNRLDQLLPSHTYLDYYIRARYVDMAETCPINNEKAAELLLLNTQTRPYFTRAWIALGSYANDFPALQQAQQLSPNRWQIFSTRAQIHLSLDETDEALHNLNVCIVLDPLDGTCWWQRAQLNFTLGTMETVSGDMKTADEKGYFSSNNPQFILKLAVIYNTLGQYEDAAYQIWRLTQQDPQNVRYHALLASAYRSLGDYKKMQEELALMLELDPSQQDAVDAFLKTLPQ
jgi:O-antigen ligase